mmetsp:Transcript_17112/g.64826  ORF Transcript_17112/g.64826 Transcript_17112/m.64826 type:complete len:228 (+) Transcript_17112:1974-2657(+)
MRSAATRISAELRRRTRLSLLSRAALPGVEVATVERRARSARGDCSADGGGPAALGESASVSESVSGTGPSPWSLALPRPEESAPRGCAPPAPRADVPLAVGAAAAAPAPAAAPFATPRPLLRRSALSLRWRRSSRIPISTVSTDRRFSASATSTAKAHTASSSCRSNGRPAPLRIACSTAMGAADELPGPRGEGTAGPGRLIGTVSTAPVRNPVFLSTEESKRGLE